MDCPHRGAVSPENPACGWCRRYRVNLDADGRLCRACREEPGFRTALARQAAARCRADAAPVAPSASAPSPASASTSREGFAASASSGSSEASGGSAGEVALDEAVHFCATFDQAVDGAVCARCRGDPAFRAFLHGQAEARRRASGAADAGVGVGRAAERAESSDSYAADTVAGAEAVRARGAMLSAWRAAAAADGGFAGTDDRAEAVVEAWARTRWPGLPGTRAARVAGCAARGAALREDMAACCGGRRRAVPVFACARRGEATSARCAECADWSAP